MNALERMYVYKIPIIQIFLRCKKTYVLNKKYVRNMIKM